jgi:hypothetical protein
MKKSCLLFLLLLMVFSAKASHISYTDITYKWISGLTYEFTLTLYRDCGGAAAPLSVTINVCSPSGGSTPDIIATPVAGTGLPVFPVCSNPLSVCVGGTDEGFQKYVYKKTYTFSSAKSDWTLYYGYCCRESIITNVVSPLITGTGLKLVINNLDYPGNSSPVFNDEPVLFACCNQSYAYNQSAADIDGDSLVYSLYYPYTDNVTCTGGANISYNGAFTYLQPLTSSPAMSMDPLTGYLTIYPVICTEVSVMGVKIEEYRGGVLVGYILRDNMIMVTNEVATAVPETEKNALSVFPNPATDNILVRSLISGKLSLVDLSGKKVYETILSGEKEIDLSAFPSGIYMLELNAENRRSVKRIIKN